MVKAVCGDSLRASWVRAGFMLMIAVGSLQAGEPFHAEKATYEQTLLKIYSEWEDNCSRVAAQYLKDLDALDEALKEQSDLEGLVALRDEKERFIKSKELREPSDDSEESYLAGLQKKTMERRHMADLIKAKKVYALTRSYGSKLTQLQKDLVKSNKIDEAMAVKTVLAELSGQADYTEAVRLLTAEREKAKETESSSSEPRRPSRSRSITRASAEHLGKEISLYPLGGEPAADSKRCKDVFTSRQSRATAANIRATLEEIVDRTSRKEKSSSYSKYIYTDHSFMPRITITSGSGNTFNNCLLLLDIYGKSGSTPARQMRQEIRIPQIAPKLVQVVDGMAYTYQETEYDYRYSSSYDEQYFSRPEYLGYMVTLFDEDKQLIYQRCTSSLLVEFASDAFP